MWASYSDFQHLLKLFTLRFYLLWSPYKQAIIFRRCGFYFLSSCSSFFLAYSQRSQIGYLPYLHTSCGLSANLACMFKMCCTRLAEDIQNAKIAQKSPAALRPTNSSDYIFATKAYIESQKKNLLNSKMSSITSSQYDQLWLTNGWDGLANLGDPSKTG